MEKELETALRLWSAARAAVNGGKAHGRCRQRRRDAWVGLWKGADKRRGGAGLEERDRQHLKAEEHDARPSSLRSRSPFSLPLIIVCFGLCAVESRVEIGRERSCGGRGVGLWRLNGGVDVCVKRDKESERQSVRDSESESTDEHCRVLCERACERARASSVESSSDAVPAQRPTRADARGLRLSGAGRGVARGSRERAEEPRGAGAEDGAGRLQERPAPPMAGLSFLFLDPTARLRHDR
eukprot:1000726-Rhodomonas_salina.1